MKWQNIPGLSEIKDIETVLECFGNEDFINDMKGGK